MKETAKRLIASALAAGVCFGGAAGAYALRLPGDTDGDGAVTAADARLALRMAVGLSEPPFYGPFTPADADSDGSVTAADARAILRAAVELQKLGDETPRSDAGFPVETADGVTHVGGVLIANKTYSLPRDYAPGALTPETQAAFDEMQQDAYGLGLGLWISSGYRSWELQQSLYDRYCAADGKAFADRYSARPGHSEHQTGLALDLNTVTQSFAYTAEGRWVAANCWRYGFILRYPKEKESVTGYMYEPWHLRYLGKDLAQSVYESGLCLEEYLGIGSVYDQD